MRVAADKHLAVAKDFLEQIKSEVGEELVNDILHAPQLTESQLMLQRLRVEKLIHRLQEINTPLAKQLLSVAEHLVRRTVWLIGGDGSVSYTHLTLPTIYSV